MHMQTTINDFQLQYMFLQSTCLEDTQRVRCYALLHTWYFVEHSEIREVEQKSEAILLSEK